MTDPAKARARRFLTCVVGVGLAVCSLAAGAAPTGSQCTAGVGRGNLELNINSLQLAELKSPNLISAIQQSGAGWIRINLFWAWTETKPGIYDWSAADAGLAKLQADHIHVLLTLMGPVPCWALASKSSEACTGPKETVPPPALWADYVRAAVTRYSGTVHYFDIWNEPDSRNFLDTPDNHQRLIDYRDNILIPGAAALHAADPTAKVVAPEIVTNPTWDTSPGPKLAQALTTVLSGAVGRDVDVVSIHSYPYDNDPAFGPLELGKAARDTMKTLGMGNKQLWLTETNVGIIPSKFSSMADYKKAQISLLQGQISQALSERVYDKVFWSSLTDGRPMGTRKRDAIGLIENIDYKTFVWTPRPAFTVFQQLVRSNCEK